MSANDPAWDEQQWRRPAAGSGAGLPSGFPVPPGAISGSNATSSNNAIPGNNAAPDGGSTSGPASGGPAVGGPAMGGPAMGGDSAWSRGGSAGEPPTYTGPPRPIPGSAASRPPTVIRAAPPRTLPEQDLAGLDADERQARTLTYGVGMITGAVALLILFVLCGRILF